MPRYDLYVSNGHSRVKYPKGFDLPDMEAARGVALRVARVFFEAVPYWNDLSSDQKDKFVVEIIEEGGLTIWTVPFSEAAEPKP